MFGPTRSPQAPTEMELSQIAANVSVSDRMALGARGFVPWRALMTAALLALAFGAGMSKDEQDNVGRATFT